MAPKKYLTAHSHWNGDRWGWEGGEYANLDQEPGGRPCDWEKTDVPGSLSSFLPSVGKPRPAPPSVSSSERSRRVASLRPLDCWLVGDFLPRQGLEGRP